MADLLTPDEIDDLLSGGEGGFRKSLHEDHQVSDLICEFTLNYFRRNPNPPSAMLKTILEVAGVFEPCYLQQILVKALKPLAEEYADTKYSDLFVEEFNIYRIENAFAENEKKIVEAASAAIVEALQARGGIGFKQAIISGFGFHRRLQDIADLFDLTIEEHEIIAFCAIKQAYVNFCMLERNLRKSGDREHLAAHDGYEETVYFADFFSFDKETFRKLTHPDGKLFHLGIISSDMLLFSELYKHIFENDFRPLRRRFYKERNTVCRSFSGTGIADEQLETVKAIVETRSPEQSINILVEITPQNNGRESVLQLVERLGFQMIEIAEPDPDFHESYKNLFRTQAIWVAQNYAAANGNLALIIDNTDLMVNAKETVCDSYFLGEIGSKRRNDVMTELMTHAGVVQFWLTSSITDIDPYIRHHFDYALQPVADGFSGRLNFWKERVEKYSLADIISFDDIKKFSARYQLDSGMIDKALRNSANLLKNGWKKQRICRHIEDLLSNTGKMDTAVSWAASALPDAGWLVAPEHLNIEPEEDFKLLLDALKHSQQQLKPEGFRIAILISGLPGTGKTFLARYIADVLNRRLILKTAGSVLDKWVGETEKSIKQSFDEAQRAGAVLFYDEIDSILTTREKATQQWQISHVNEVLAGLDNFKGVFIAATNFETILDKASLRRFNFHFQLGSLKPQGNAAFYKTMLMPLAIGRMTRKEARLLTELSELTPSDFGILRQRLELLPGVRNSHAELLQGLIERRNLRLGRKPAETPDISNGKYLLQARKEGE